MPVNRKSLFLKVLIFSIVLAIGSYFSINVFSNYQVSSFATTGIIYGSYANPDYGMTVNSFSMDINTQNQTVILSIDFGYNSVGNYTLLMTLPYRIDSFQNLSSGDLYLKSTPSGSIAMFNYDIKNISNSGYTFVTASALLHVNGSILDKVFETYTLNLPFGGSITDEVSQELDNMTKISPFVLIGSGLTGGVSISVPYSAIITQTTQQIDGIFPEKDFQVLEFSINEFKPFRLQYIDSAQERNFEEYLLIGGVMFGVAASGFAEIAVELISNKYKHASVQKNNSESLSQAERGEKRGE